jgi:CDP-diacylglycerol--glycerol-3-phosphate 3-phosphatidyltransferase
VQFSIYQLKPAFQRLLQPLVKGLAACGITPNQVTISTLLISIAVASLLWQCAATAPVWWVFPLWMLLRMAFNALDGMLAVYQQQQTKLGALLNEMADVLSDIALYLPLFAVTGLAPYWVLLLLLGAMLSEFAGVLALQIRAARRFDGPMGKSDRAFWLSLLAIGIALELPPPLLNGLLALIGMLTLLTCVNRLAKALNQWGQSH